VRVTVLGAGTLLPHDVCRSPGHLVETGDVRLLLDCGSGVVHGFQRWGLDWATLTHVAISHYHTDHFGDLPALLWALRHGVSGGRTLPLNLLGPAGLHDRLEGLATAYGDYILEPGFPLHIQELGARSRFEDPQGRFTLFTHPTPHTEESVAYRVETAVGRMGYTGDTGPAPELGAFMAGADLLVSECAFPVPGNPGAHLDPTTVAEIARGADPRLLILTHLYPEVDRGELPGRIRDLGFPGEVVVGRDGLRVQWHPAGTPDSPEGWTPPALRIHALSPARE